MHVKRRQVVIYFSVSSVSYLTFKALECYWMKIKEKMFISIIKVSLRGDRMA